VGTPVTNRDQAGAPNGAAGRLGGLALAGPMHAGDLGDGRGHKRRVGNRRQRDEVDSVFEGVRDPGRDLEREARFADPGGSDEGEEADAVAEERMLGPLDLPLPANQASRLSRQQRCSRDSRGSEVGRLSSSTHSRLAARNGAFDS